MRHRPQPKPLEQHDEVVWNSVLTCLYDQICESKIDWKTAGQWPQERWLAATLFTALVRSHSAKDGIQLAVGAIVDVRNCPTSMRTLLRQLLMLKMRIPSDAKLRSACLSFLLPHAISHPSMEHSCLFCTRLLQVARYVTEHIDFWKVGWQNLMDVNNPPTKAAAVSSSSCSDPINTSSSKIETERIWRSVINRTFQVGEQALQQNWISQQDVRDQEPYLYLGLIGATILEAVERSLAPPQIDGVRLAIQAGPVTKSTCPSELMPLFLRLMNLKERMGTLNLNTHEMHVLRLMVLYAQAEDKTIPPITTGQMRQTEIARLASTVQEVTIPVSQMKMFKEQFNPMLQVLGVLELKEQSTTASSSSSTSSKTGNSSTLSTAQTAANPTSSTAIHANQVTSSTPSSLTKPTTSKPPLDPPPSTNIQSEHQLQQQQQRQQQQQHQQKQSTNNATATTWLASAFSNWFDK